MASGKLSATHSLPGWAPVARAPCSQEHCCLFPCWIESANPRMNFVCTFNKVFLERSWYPCVLRKLCREWTPPGGTFSICVCRGRGGPWSSQQGFDPGPPPSLFPVRPLRGRLVTVGHRTAGPHTAGLQVTSDVKGKGTSAPGKDKFKGIPGITTH